MAIENIKNQPIQFEDPLFANQNCLNNDTLSYAQLLQDGDTMCVQIINVADTSTYNLQPLTVNGNILINGDFSNNLNGWHQGELSTSTDDGAWPWGVSYEWYLDNGGAQRMSSATKGIGLTLPSGTVGDIFLISLYFETYQNVSGISVNLGDFATNSWNYVNKNGVDPLNIDNRFTVPLSSYAGLDLWFDGLSPASKALIKDIKVYNVPYLLFVADSSFLDGWMYVESLNGYQIMNANYTITSVFQLFNNQNFNLKFNVKNLNDGSIDFFDADGNLIVSATENKEYSIFGLYTGTTGTITISVTNNNSVGGIIYNINVGEVCYDHKFKLINQTTNSESQWFDSSDLDFPVYYYQDRIFWCFDMGQINDFDTGTPLVDGCYNVVIDDCGIQEITSSTKINYTTTAHNCSVWMEASNTGYAFDFFFNSVNTNITFVLGQRLRLLQFNAKYLNKSEDYLYSNGNMTRTFAQTGKKREAWFDYCDEATHDVIRVQLLSDVLTIDGKQFYYITEDYEPEWQANGKGNLAQSRVELMAVEEKTLFNKNC